MKVIEFKSEQSKAVILGCGECGRVYPGNPHVAEMCCQPVVCDCGDTCKKSYTKCEGCLREKERQRLARIFTNASKCADFSGPIYDPYAEAFYASIEALLDDDELPPYVHPCHENPPQLDLRSILDDAEEQMELEDGIEMDWVGEQELAKAVKVFNEKQTFRGWYPDMKRVIDLHGKR